MSQVPHDEVSHSPVQRRATRRTRAKRRQSVYEGAMWVGVTQGTYRFGKLRNIWKRYGRQPSLFEILFNLVWLGFAIVACSNAMIDPESFMSVAMPGALLGAIWLMHVVVSLEGWAHPRPSFRQSEAVRSPLNYLRWVVFPLALILVGVSMNTNWALAARVKMSEKILEIHVRTAATNSREEYSKQQPLPAGFFRIYLLEEKDGSVRMITSPGARVTSAGIAYSQRVPPGNPKEDRYQRIYGNWWRWERTKD